MSKNIILYHGTSVESARKIKEHGFKPDLKYNWDVKSKKGFVYLSKAYAPFYAMTSKTKVPDKAAIIKVSVPKAKLYPEDDFIMAGLGKPKYSQAELDKVNLEDYKQYSDESLKHMGNASAKPKDIKVLGIREFDSRNLVMVSDPSISPINYLIMGEYYQNLTEWIYEGNEPRDFLRSDKNPQRIPDEMYRKMQTGNQKFITRTTKSGKKVKHPVGVKRKESRY